MPTYEYECTVCSHAFELFQTMSAPLLKKCPKCGKKVRRLLGKGGGIIFKGSGFYSTDYRSPTYADSAKKDTDSTPAKTEGKPGTSESKPSASESKPASTEKTSAPAAKKTK
jgi:putative FmdB family regulatory protein